MTHARPALSAGLPTYPSTPDSPNPPAPLARIMETVNSHCVSSRSDARAARAPAGPPTLWTSCWNLPGSASDERVSRVQRGPTCVSQHALLIPPALARAPIRDRPSRSICSRFLSPMTTDYSVLAPLALTPADFAPSSVLVAVNPSSPRWANAPATFSSLAGRRPKPWTSRRGLCEVHPTFQCLSRVSNQALLLAILSKWNG